LTGKKGRGKKKEKKEGVKGCAKERRKITDEEKDRRGDFVKDK